MAPSKQAPVVLTRVPRRGEATPRAGTPRPCTRCASSGCSRGAWSRAGPRTRRSAPGWPTLEPSRVLSKPSFARAAAVRRCLVPAEGWYEWQMSPTRDGRAGQAAQAAVPRPAGRRGAARLGGAVRVLAGPRRRRTPEDPAAWLVTFTIITTGADPGLDRIHDRQPLVLEPGGLGLAGSTRTQDDPTRSRTSSASTDPDGSRHTRSRRRSTRRGTTAPELVEPAPAETLEGVVDPMTG